MVSAPWTGEDDERIGLALLELLAHQANHQYLHVSQQHLLHANLALKVLLAHQDRRLASSHRAPGEAPPEHAL